MSKGIQQVRDHIAREIEIAKSWHDYEGSDSCDFCDFRIEYLDDMAFAITDADGYFGSWQTRTMGEALALLAFAGLLNGQAQIHAARKHGADVSFSTHKKVNEAA